MFMDAAYQCLPPINVSNVTLVQNFTAEAVGVFIFYIYLI